MIYLYDFSIDTVSLRDCEKLICQLPDFRKEQYQKFRFEKDKIRCVISYCLLKYALTQRFSLDNLPEIEMNEYGKPFFTKHPQLFFSISHSGNHVMVSLGTAESGIDTEEPQEDTAKIYRYVLSGNEKKMLSDESNADDAFIRLWTVKEAYTKMIGKGLGINFTSLSVTYDQSSPVIHLSDGQTFSNIYQRKTDDGYWYTVCFCGENTINPLEKVTLQDLPENWFKQQ